MEIDFLQPKGIDNFSNLGIRIVSGINEYIDNAVEAKAKKILVILRNNGDSVDLIIIENGKGMDGETLQYGISFGGENAGVKNKEYNDIGKFHAGMTISSLSLSNHTDIYSNNGQGWIKNYIDKEEIKRTRKISSSEECELPKEISNILEEIKIKNDLDIELKTGTVIVLKNLDKEIIGPSNFDIEVSELFNNSCIRYHKYLANEGSIYIMVNSVKDIRKCEAINPLLKDQKLLKDNNLEILANFKYKNILTIKEVLPYSKIDGFMDIEFVLIRKIKKNDKMQKSHDLVKMNMENQGSYFSRNNLNIIRAKKIGYNKRHNSLNGVRNYSNFDGKWDTVLGININKSLCNPNSRFYELLDERLKKVYTHLRSVLAKNEILNPPIIEIDSGRICEPEIIINLTEKDKKLGAFPIELGKISGGNEDGVITIDKNGETVDRKKIKVNNLNRTSATEATKNFEIETSMKLGEKVPIIFAAKGKPDLKFNMSNGDIKLTVDNDSYYVYNKEISNLGVRKSDVEEWCSDNNISEIEFYKRLRESIRKEAKEQIKFFDYYMENIYSNPKKDFFLFPEVYLNVNVKSWDVESKQCVDFLMILPNKEKIIIEIDGVGHYGSKKNGIWQIDQKKYAVDRKFDREMQFQGYKIFRFGNYEISNNESLISEFFKELFS